jgi:hypothetical protein
VLIQETAAFLQKNRDLFPPGSLPAQPVQLALLALRFYKLFAGMKMKLTGEAATPDAVIVHAITTALNHP